MNVCLISAPTANQFHNRAVGETEAARTIGELAPVGILSLAAVLEEQGLQPAVVELNRLYYEWRQASNGHTAPEEDFCRFVAHHFADRHFDFFGLSTVCSSYPLTLRIAAELKRLHPESVVALGGPQASVVDFSTMRAFPFIDLVVRGEAEQSLPALLDALATRYPLDAVPGITFRRGGEMLRTPDAPLILDLDSLPFPAFHLHPDVGFCRHFPMELGRGCPFACTFCSTNDFFRRRFRLKSPARMIADMRRIKETYGINSFELVHDMFTVDRKRVVAFCEALLDSGEKFYWGCSARTDCIDDELIALLAGAGCRGIFFGIETGSARLQKIIDKGLDLEISAARVRSCDEHKINTAVSLITGFPEETMVDLRDTVAFFMDSLRFDHADPQLQILAPLSDTPIHRQHKDKLVLDDSLSDMSYRGWIQDQADHDMIAGHPEIFSNFYSVPALLNRAYLTELRDFLLNGMKLFRWLLLGVHQDSGNIVDVFDQWQGWRSGKQLGFPHQERAAYYADKVFARDFIEFAQSYYVPEVSKAPLAMRTLAEYESALLKSQDHSARATEPVPAAADENALMSTDSRPRLHPGIYLIELDADYQEIIRRLRSRLPLVDLREKQVTLVATPAGVLQLSPLSAELLRLCQGRNTIREITEEFLVRGFEIPGVPPDMACLAGIDMLRRQKLIAIEQATPVARA